MFLGHVPSVLGQQVGTAKCVMSGPTVSIQPPPMRARADDFKKPAISRAEGGLRKRVLGGGLAAGVMVAIVCSTAFYSMCGIPFFQRIVFRDRYQVLP
jgi:hypothetical protein